MQLTQSQLGILEQHAAAGDRIAYWTALESFVAPNGEYSYAGLALDVVTNTPLSGATANAYFLRYAETREGKTISPEQLALIGYGLMQEDFALRSVSGSDLTVEQIQDYHEEVFRREADVGPDAWTPNIYLNDFETPEEQQAAWDEIILSGAGSAMDIAQRFATRYNPSITFPIVSVIPGDTIETYYLNDLVAAGFKALISEDPALGPYTVISETGAVFGGSSEDDVLEGGSGSDVLIGSDGNDVLVSSEGSDRLYGGQGADRATFASFADGVTIQLGGINDPLWTGFGEERLVQVTSSDGAISTLIDIERVIGTSKDDVLAIRGEFTRYSVSGFTTLDVGINLGSEANGDLLDLSGITSGGIVIDTGGDISLLSDGSNASAQSLTIIDLENIIGTQWSDTIQGGAVDNEIEGGSGDDVIDGGSGNDTIQDGSGSDIINGGDENDLIKVTIEVGLPRGEDSEEEENGPEEEGGSDGNSVPNLQILGFDQIDGGAGIDTAQITGSSENLFVDQSSGDMLLTYRQFATVPGTQDQYLVTDVLSNFEKIVGTDTADFSYSRSAVNFDGTPVIETGNGGVEFADLTRVVGSQFGDELVASDTVRNIEGGGGADTISATGQTVWVSGGSGNDVITIIGGTASGDTGNDVMQTVDGTLRGGDGNDTLIATGSAFLDGGAGADDLFASSGSVVSGDSLDRLFLNGELIAPENGRIIPYSASSALPVDFFDGYDWVLAIRQIPTLGFVHSSQSEVLWRAWLFTNPSFDIYDGLRDVRTELADLEIPWFSLGDFGIGTNGIPNSSSYGSVYAENPGTGAVELLSIASLPVGNIQPEAQTGDETALPNLVFAQASDDFGTVETGVFEGSGGDDDLIGSAGADILTGLDGRDTLTGLEGDDSLIGGVGSDRLFGDAGSDTLDGGDNFDSLDGGAGDDVLDGGKGIDTLVGGTGDDRLTGGSGGDVYVFDGQFGHDTVVGFEIGTAERLDLRAVANVYGAADIDIALENGSAVLRFDQDGDGVFEAANSITLAGITDTSGLEAALLTTPSGGVGLHIQGTLGDDVLDGTVDNDTIIGGDGKDTITAGAGADSVDGNVGADRIFGGAGDDTLNGGDNFDRLEGGTGDDLINAGKGEDTIDGGAGNDTIIAGYSNDLIIYSGGHDELNRAYTRGSDTLDLSLYSSAEVAFSLAPDSSVLITVPDGSVLLDRQVRQDIGHRDSNIETILFSDITLDERAIRERAITDQASAGDDLIVGTNHADTLDGGAGNDTLRGDYGDDLFRYDGGDDVIDFTRARGQDTLDLGQYASSEVSFTVVDRVDILVTTPDGTVLLDRQGAREIGHRDNNIEAILFSDAVLDDAGLRARAVSDQATAGNDLILGTNYADTLDGGAGNDTLQGDYGDDLYRYDGGDDVIDFTRARGQDTLDLGQYASSEVSFTVVDRVDILVTTPDGTVLLDRQGAREIGHRDNNIETILFSDAVLDDSGLRARAVSDQATAGDDVVTGTVFGDTISGGAGNDTLTGENGVDTFVFGDDGGHDVITDFEVGGGERIDLSGLTGVTGVGGLRFTATADGGTRIEFDNDGDGIFESGISLVVLGASLSAANADQFIF